jgi:hypothetical protein
MFTFENNGPEIVSTNYWLSEHAQRGYVYLSINARAFFACSSQTNSPVICPTCYQLKR